MAVRAFVTAITGAHLNGDDNMHLDLAVEYMDNVLDLTFGETVLVTFAGNALPNTIEVAVTNAIINHGLAINPPMAVTANAIVMWDFIRGHLI